MMKFGCNFLDLHTPAHVLSLHFSDLLQGKLSEFKISANEEEQDGDFDEDFLLDDEDDYVYDESREIQIDCSIETPFDVMKQDMMPIKHGIYKKILAEGTGEVVPATARVTLDWCAFCEGQASPFETTWTNRRRPLSQKIGEDMLPGFYFSLLSMKQGEVAKFIVPYQLLYGVLGCEWVSVPPRTNCLYLIRLIAFDDVGDSAAINDEFIDEYPSFENVMQRVTEVRKSAKTHFVEGRYEEAARDFKKCITALKFCQGPDEEERITVLEQMYVNVCVCYNKLDRPLEVLKMKDDLNNCLSIIKNCKAIFQIARAHFKQGDYEDALRYLIKAQLLEPNNKEVAEELRKVNEANETYKKNIKEISKKALQNSGDSKSAKKDEERTDAVFMMLKNYVKKFLDDESKTKETLPLNLSPHETEMIMQIARDHGLTLETRKEGNDSIVLLVKS